jgi:hypothetical protein
VHCGLKNTKGVFGSSPEQCRGCLIWTLSNLPPYMCMHAFISSYPSLSRGPWIGSNLGSLTTYRKETKKCA